MANETVYILTRVNESSYYRSMIGVRTNIDEAFVNARAYLNEHYVDVTRVEVEYWDQNDTRPFAMVTVE